MKNKGFTLIEIMVVTGIGMGLAAIVFSIFILMNTGFVKTGMYASLKQQAQIALESSQNYLEKAVSGTIDITSCEPGQCMGNKITFQVPVVTQDAVAGTVFTNLGELKKGAYYLYSNGDTVMVKDGYFEIYVNNNKKLVADVWIWGEFGGGGGGGGGGEGGGGGGGGPENKRPLQFINDSNGPFSKLFNDMFGIKDVYAATVKNILNTKIMADKVIEANFTSDATKKLITIKMRLENKQGLSGETIYYDAESQVAPLN